MKKTYLLFFGIIICILLVGCRVGESKVFDVYLDENGDRHFMGIGKIGSSGDEKRVENNNSSYKVNDIQGNYYLSI